MEVIRLRDEYIKLGQALKAAGLVESGVEAKEVITEGLVTVMEKQIPDAAENYMPGIWYYLMEKR